MSSEIRPDDLLIERLAGNLRPVRRRRPWLEMAVLGALFGVELALLLGAGHMRIDMPHAMGMPSFWWKLAGLTAIIAISSTTALLSLDPTRSPRLGLRVIVLTVLAVLVAGWGVDAAQTAWLTGGETLWRRLAPQSGLRCTRTIVELAVPVAIALGVLMRRGASVDLAGSAWAAGISASGWGALAFAFACPFDDPLYLAVWYGVAFGIVTIGSRLLLPLILRW